MRHVLIIGVALLSAYFFLAAFLPRLRIRYGLRSLITLYPRGRPQEYYGLPRMGQMACVGTGLFLAFFPVFDLGVTLSLPEVPKIAFLMMLTGFILGFAGASRDKRKGWVSYRPRKEEVNPQSGANGRQPSSSDPNRTSSAAASRRSP